MTNVALTTWIMTDFFPTNGQGHDEPWTLLGYWSDLTPLGATKLATKPPNRCESMLEGEKDQLKFLPNHLWRVIPLGWIPTQNAYSVARRFQYP